MQIAECKYTVTLTAGDPGSDGHGQEIRESYVVNRSPSELQNAFNKARKKWPALAGVAEEYDDYHITTSDYRELEKLSLFDDTFGIRFWSDNLGRYCSLEEDDTILGGHFQDYEDYFLLYLRAARLILPDLVWQKVPTKTIHLGGYGLPEI